MKLPVNTILPLAALALVSLAGAATAQSTGVAAAPGGPAADYPMVIGDAFTIDGKTYTPTDQLNYDAVGYASFASNGMESVTAAHKTLPVPSYVEVTSLDSGRTILVRIEARGPMVNGRLVALSPAAAAQLGLTPGAPVPVRVRRVNPPEQERALLRAGRTAPERMETPEPLLRVLKRKLADKEPLGPSGDAAGTSAAVFPDAEAVTAETARADHNGDAVPSAPPGLKPVDPDMAVPVAKPAPVTTPAAIRSETPPAAVSAAMDALIVQVAAFSTEQRAQAAAAKLGAKVEKPGKYWLMRMGPFTSRGEAATALEKAKAAGYSDARIQNAD